jgi:hypothetical protein
VANTVNIGVLVEDTGEAPRTLQHWCDLRILQPLPATHKRGRGYYRSFLAEPYHGERVWALVASALSKLRIPLGDILHIVDGLRPRLTLDWHRDHPAPGDDRDAERRLRESPLYQAITTDNDVLVLLKADPDGVTPWFMKFSTAITPKMLEPEGDPVMTITTVKDGKETIEKFPSAEGVLADQIRFTREVGGQAHLLNLTAIFKPLRS